MKKVLILMMFVLFCGTSLGVISSTTILPMDTIMISTAEAGVLPPSSCVFAEELGWSNKNWNGACLYELALDCCDYLGDPWYG